MFAPSGVGFPYCMVIGVWRYLRIATGKVYTFLFVVCHKGHQMDKGFVIFQENELFGAKNSKGEVIIPPQYMEMQPFSCGLSLVRNNQYQYAYINKRNEQVIPFGTYQWCDPLFVCGFARVLKENWGVIDTLGNIVVQLKYDKIWTLKEEYIFSIKAFVDNKEERLNLHQLGNKVIFDCLTYICTYSVEAFKELVHCERLYVKAHPNTKQLYFTYGANMGFVSLKGIPKEPVISIVVNSSGKIFPLLMEKSDIGKASLSSAKAIHEKNISRTTVQKTSFWDYEAEKMNDTDNWSDPYGDEQAYYGGWSREDVESGLADAYEGDLDARWNND